MRCNQLIAVLVCFCMIGLNQSFAQQPQNSAGLVVRAYNVSDLVRQSNDYPLEIRKLVVNGTQFISGRGLINGIEPPPETGPNLAPLIDLIMRTVEPTSWGDTGGKISNLGTTLVVRQTSEIQNRVQQLLDEIRKSSGPAQVLTVRTTWVLCAARELPDPKTEVTADWINKQKGYCESQITCFSGQTVHISTGQSRSVISDVQPVIANGAIGFDPTMTTVLSGILLQITPQSIPNSDTTILDVQTVINQAAAPDETKPLSVGGRTEGASGAAIFGANIDRMTTISQEFKTTARVPMKKKIIVGGMTLDPSGTDHGGQQLYLVVEIDAGK